MLKKIRNSYTARIVSMVLAIQLFVTSVGFNNVYAGDGGPDLPEGRSFEPVGTNQMVDLFTGDFTYNIPLFNIPGPDGGYPINLAYHSGIQMEQDATWCGLGWNINVGTISRQVRNLPDDFGGKNATPEITVKTDMRPNWTVGAGVRRDWEILGFEKPKIEGNVSVTAGMNLYYNNYKGVGYTLDAGFSLNLGKQNFNPDTRPPIMGDIGFNFKLDSQEGVSSAYSLGLTESGTLNTWTQSVSTGFNSRTGWQRDLNVQASYKRSMRAGEFESNHLSGDNNVTKFAQSGGSSISFARTAVNMSIPNAMRGGNATFSLAKGPNTVGVLKKTSGNVFYNTSTLKNKNQAVSYKGFGYMYYQNADDISADLENDKRVKDISRENDGMIHKNSRRLGTPNLNYDIYTVTGQGIGNMFRPFRDDIGTAVSPKVKSEYHGGNLGFEKGTPTPLKRLGIDVGYNYSHNKQEYWNSDNSNALSITNYAFGSANYSLSDGVYFQNYGEQTVDDLGYHYGTSVASEKPVVFGLKADDNFYDIVANDQNNNGSAMDIKNTRVSRKRRAKDIEAFTNAMIMNMTRTSTVIADFKLDYYPAPSSTGYNKTSRVNYDAIRSQLTPTHVGGYMATNETGMRYVYGLPAINTSEKDIVFSVAETTADATSTLKDLSLKNNNTEVDYSKKGTDKYYNSVEKGQYAHSYLMTSILGTDYIDNDGVSGVSEGDQGYWVRFDYTRTASDYKWRAPYEKSQYDKGYETSFKDGKARYSYGTKEVWYMATAETKTHIAEFKISPRKDANEAKGELGQGTAVNKYMKLDRIDVYAKSERYPNGVFNANAKPIQSCHFVYDYSLCTGTPDNFGEAVTQGSNEISNTGGKLTLKQFYFTYRNNQTGKSRPYKFEYNTTVEGQTPTYDRSAVDRWGNYQPNVNASNIDYPYIDPTTTKATMDARAGLWNMKSISLPSGGKYEVDYESDSYAYVQNQVAMHMVKITSLDPYSSGASGTGNINHPKVANSGQDTPSMRNVYFKLEHPIPSSGLTTAQVQAIMDKYMLQNQYLYFKIKINVNKNVNTTEYVGGYARVNEVKVDPTSIVGGNYQWGYVQLDFMKVDGVVTNFHPFTEVGARHLKYNQADLLYDNPPNADKDKLSKSDAKNMGWSLISNVTDIKDMFMNFTNMIYSSGRCTDIELGKSYIRLRTPDKIKYGGGHRVKEIRVMDNWNSFVTGGAEATSVYGTVYDYDLKDANGVVISSSGVASYEPLVGGDEIPLRNPVKGWEDKNIASKNSAQTYSEDPGNESLFPAPSVGYSQVRVMSKVTAEKMANPSSTTVNYSGITVHKFYTAKDYPVIQDQSELETNKTLQKSRLLVPALIVNVDRTRLGASQGYYIENNNMHGQPRASKEIGFDDQGKEQEISNVEYNYYDIKSFTTNLAGETVEVRRLQNQVDVLYSDILASDPTKSDIRSSTLATEVEFIPETRYAENKHISGGLNLNFEYGSGVFIFYPIPSFSWKVEKTGTVVTNKIVNKTGILKSVVVTQRGSIIQTENLVFDDMTGQPLLTSVTNDYGDKVYNYSILANEQYEGTRGSYQNIGFTAMGQNLGTLDATKGIQKISFTTPAQGDVFYEGDVVVAVPMTNPSTEDNTRAKLTFVFVKKNATNDYSVETNTALSGLYRFTIIRSGRRNLLAMPIENITALSKPTEGRVAVPCTDATGTRSAQTYNKWTINNVLAINAVELGGNWYKDTRQLQAVPATWFNEAYFSRGFAGNYSAIRPYAYVDDRIQTGTGVQLKTDGVLNNVELFDWNHLQSDCPTKWKMTEQITLKNTSSANVESKNILGTYSSKLYGKSGTEPIAVAGNAKNSEIGFENFEEYPTGALAVANNATTNMNFYTTDLAGRFIEDRFDVSAGGGTLSNGTTICSYVDIPTSAVNTTNSTLFGYTNYTLRLHFDAKNGTPSKEVLVKVATPVFTIDNGKVKMAFTDNTLSSYVDNKWRGELFARKTIPTSTSAGNANVGIITTKGHTGTKCLKIDGTGTNPEFLQGRLTLKQGESYQFTGWFGTDNSRFLKQNYSRIFESDFQVKFYKVDGTAMPTATITFKESDVLQGGFIENWQKFALNFTVPTDAHYASIVLPKANEVYSDELGDYIQRAYYDDLRLQPLDAGMTGYVYNQENQRLEAVLDANNYATFYYYDDQGNLFLVKQETEKGIITQQESRSFNKVTE